VATISSLLKITGLFAKEPYKRDCILQKRPVLLALCQMAKEIRLKPLADL